MPLYTYLCPACGAREDAFRRMAERYDAPLHCRTAMELLITPVMIAPRFDAYRAVMVDVATGNRPTIKNRSEHKAFLARNGYQEVGDDKSMAPSERSMEALTHPVDYDLDVSTL